MFCQPTGRWSKARCQLTCGRVRPLMTCAVGICTVALERRAVEDFIETPRHVDLARLDGDGNDLALNSPFTTWLRLVSKETTHCS